MKLFSFFGGTIKEAHKLHVFLLVNFLRDSKNNQKEHSNGKIFLVFLKRNILPQISKRSFTSWYNLNNLIQFKAKLNFWILNA